MKRTPLLLALLTSLLLAACGPEANLPPAPTTDSAAPLAPTEVTLTDALASADAVVGKPGYGTFTEAACIVLDAAADQLAGAINMALLNRRLSETSRSRCLRPAASSSRATLPSCM